MQPSRKYEILFVDDDEYILAALRASLRRQRKVWNMQFALGGEEGVKIIEEGNLDVVVTDMRMPTIDGIGVLKKAREVVPDAIRLVMSGQAEPDSAVAAIPYTHQWLSKPTESPVLINVIERSLITRELVHEGPARAALGALNRLPMVPKTYQRLTAALASEEASVDLVTSIVANDPCLSARLLQMANSAFFGLPRHLDDVREAVGYLGFDTVAQLVFAAEVIHESDSPNNSKALEDFQARAILTSRVAAEIMKGDERATAAGTAGMLHDIGWLGLCMDPKIGPEAGVDPSQANSLEIESEKFGATHADIGGALLGVWGLPSDLVEAVAHHHEPQRIQLLELDCVVAVHIAQALVHEQMLSEDEALPPCLGLDQDLVERLGLVERVEEWRQFTQKAVAASRAAEDDAADSHSAAA